MLNLFFWWAFASCLFNEKRSIKTNCFLEELIFIQWFVSTANFDNLFVCWLIFMAWFSCLILFKTFGLRTCHFFLDHKNLYLNAILAHHLMTSLPGITLYHWSLLLERFDQTTSNWWINKERKQVAMPVCVRHSSVIVV